jgi:hypothetical protein
MTELSGGGAAGYTAQPDNGQNKKKRFHKAS